MTLVDLVLRKQKLLTNKQRGIRQRHSIKSLDMSKHESIFKDWSNTQLPYPKR